MIELLRLSEEQRRLIFTNAGFQAGLLANVVEKDWWVTLILKAVFLTEYAPHLLFKGGTSLSKCWKLVSRFSEDIDLAIDRTYLGFGGEISNSKIHQLKKAACDFTSFKLKDAIQKQLLELGVPERMLMITHSPIKPELQDKDPQELQIEYPSLFEPMDYISKVVKVEVSGLSLKEPFSTCLINSVVDEEYNNYPFAGKPFEVRAVDPKRTFLEKMFLLHEEFQRKEKMRAHRMSRHLYDLERVMDTLHGWSAIHDKELYATVINHRKKFYKLSGINYDLHQPDTILFIPPATILKAYDQDYTVMRQQMIQGDPPAFEMLIRRLEELTNRLRHPVHFANQTIDEVITAAQKKDPKDPTSPNFMIESGEVTIPVEFNDFRYEVVFTRRNGELVPKAVKIINQ
jgi:hypothetical protein